MRALLLRLLRSGGVMKSGGAGNVAGSVSRVERRSLAKGRPGARQSEGLHDHARDARVRAEEAISQREIVRCTIVAAELVARTPGPALCRLGRWAAHLAATPEHRAHLF